MMHFRHHGNGKMVPDVKIILRGDSVIKKEMIAMLLAGGQGSRLGVLTSKVVTPPTLRSRSHGIPIPI